MASSNIYTPPGNNRASRGRSVSDVMQSRPSWRQQNTGGGSTKPPGESYREPTVQNWCCAIEDALDYRREYGKEATWAKIESLFYHSNDAQKGSTAPNIIMSIGDSLLSELGVPNPFFVLKALRMDLISSTPVLESCLNMMMQSMEIKKSVNTSTLHGYMWGRMTLKMGYDSEFGYDPMLDLGQQMGQVQPGAQPTILGLTLSQYDKKGRKIEYNNYSPGMPWIKEVLPHDFLVPWGTGPQLSSASWCAHRIVRHIDDIRADKKYTNTKDLQPQMSMADYVKSYLTVMKPYRMGITTSGGKTNKGGTWSDSTGEAEFVELWEIHDRRTGRLYVISTNYDKFLRNEVDYLQEDGLPFVSSTFIPTARTFWTTPDCLYLEGPQDEAIDIASIARKHRRLSLLKFYYKKGAITKQELNKMLSPEIGAAFEIDDNLGGDLKDSVGTFTPQTPNNQLQNDAQWVRSDARETIGFGRNQMGESAGGRQTAREAEIVSSKADQRLGRREQVMADLYCDIGRKLSKLIFKFWKTPRLVQVLGASGAAEWMTFTGSDLQGDYGYSVGFSSEPVETLQARQQRAITVYQTFMNDPGIDQIALRRFIIRLFNDPEITSLFLPGIQQNANLPILVPQQPQLGAPSPVAGNGGTGNGLGTTGGNPPGRGAPAGPRPGQPGGPPVQQQAIQPAPAVPLSSALM